MSHNLEFISFRVQNTLYFKDQIFHFNNPGVHLILGQNLNSGGIRNPNAVGKSLFFSLLAEFICNEPLVGSKLEKVREGRREFTFRRGKNTYLVTKEFVGRREVVAIWKNGEDLGVKGKPIEVHEKFRRILRLSNQEVYSLLYFDSRVPHPLAFGDTSARREFFSGFFRNLSAIKDIRKLIELEFNRIKELSAKKDALELQLSSVMGQIPKGWRESKEKLQKAEEKLASITEELPQILEVSRLKSAISKQKKELGELVDEYEGQNLEDVRKSAEAGRRLARKSIDAWDSYEDWRRENAQTSRDLDKLRADTEAYEEKELRLQLSKLKALVATLESSVQELSGRASEVSVEIKSINSKIASKKQDLQEHRGVSNKCPTCGGKFDNTKARSHAEDLEKELRELGTKRKDKARIKEEITTELSRSESVLRKKKVSLEKYKIIIETFEQIAALERQLTNKEKKPEVSLEEASVSLKKNEAILSALSKIESYRELVSSLQEIPKDIRLRAKSVDTQSLQEEMRNLTQEVARLSAEVATARSLVKNKSRIQAELMELSQDTDDLVVAETLKLAFDKKNIELMISKSLAERLQDQINKFAKIAYGEDYVFTVDLSSKYEILVTRFHGKKQITSDVRKLSGAEGSLFPMVLLMSVLSFVPKMDRPNVLILDEPTAHMGESNVEKFVAFLRNMQKIIPTIVVITPLSPAPYQELDPKVWTVQKKNAQARFVEGYPR